MRESLKKILLILGSVVLILATVKLASSLLKPEMVISDSQLKSFSVDELKGFDGSDDNKPIYIGYEGLIYDVSTGREYYKKGGVYHFLTGKDSTIELNFAGGGIIKKKYPIVGRLTK